MNILIVGNILKDVYLNIDSRTNRLESDKRGTKWLNLGFDTSEYYFYNRSSNLSGATVSMEVFHQLGIPSMINNSDLHFSEDGPVTDQPTETYRYIMLADDKPCYFVPTAHRVTHFVPPTEPVDFLYIDRSAELDQVAASRIKAYLDVSPSTKLVLYVRTMTNPHINSLIPRASLVFLEDAGDLRAQSNILPSELQGTNKLVIISDHRFAYQNISEPVLVERIDMMTHLSTYSIAAATILGCFVLGYSVEDSLKYARRNVEHAKLNASLSLEQLQSIVDNTEPNNLELIAKNLVFYPKGILAADESGGSIHKKFEQLSIPDTYDMRRDYRNIFFTTEHLEDYVNGVILFDETARQIADNGQNFVEYLISKRIIPGIKVDQGLVSLNDRSLETTTQGLEGIDERLAEYYQMGLRFAKWRAAFELRISSLGNILTPSDLAIEQNCQTLAAYALACQKAGLVPIVEPEVVYDGYYTIEQSASVTGKILRALFSALRKTNVDLKACVLKVNMVLAGKRYPSQSSPSEVGRATAETLKENVPSELAGVVFLSGGQTVEQATDNLAEIIKCGPFPWPVTFSFARALQDPALYAWAGDNSNTEKARQAFTDRLIANTEALKSAS